MLAAGRLEGISSQLLWRQRAAILVITEGHGPASPAGEALLVASLHGRLLR